MDVNGGPLDSLGVVARGGLSVAFQEPVVNEVSFVVNVEFHEFCFREICRGGGNGAQDAQEEKITEKGQRFEGDHATTGAVV